MRVGIILLGALLAGNDIDIDRLQPNTHNEIWLTQKQFEEITKLGAPVSCINSKPNHITNNSNDFRVPLLYYAPIIYCPDGRVLYGWP